MRTKKTFIKSGKITRTVPFTLVKFLTVDINTREVSEESHIFTLEYNKVEAENALRELGFPVVAVLDTSVHEEKLAISYDDFVRFAHNDD